MPLILGVILLSGGKGRTLRREEGRGSRGIK